MCDSIESPRKLYVWDLEGGTAFTVGTLVEANWPSPETGRSGLQAHFTPDGLILFLALASGCQHHCWQPFTAAVSQDCLDMNCSQSREEEQ